jgi:5-formyltetrahydrofolate cyclo-ligase
MLIVEINLKQKLRERILTLLRNQTEEERKQKNNIIAHKLYNCSEFKSAKTVLFYASFDGEVDTFEMMKKAKLLGKKIALPQIDRKNKSIIPKLVEYLDQDLQLGSFGILEPLDPSCQEVELTKIDLVIVPGVAFDRDHYRLGRGGGYYDRFLADLPSAISTAGLAFDFQIVPQIPHQKTHDIPVDSVFIN